MYKSD